MNIHVKSAVITDLDETSFGGEKRVFSYRDDSAKSYGLRRPEFASSSAREISAGLKPAPKPNSAQGIACFPRHNNDWRIQNCVNFIPHSNKKCGLI